MVPFPLGYCGYKKKRQILEKIHLSKQARSMGFNRKTVFKIQFTEKEGYLCAAGRKKKEERYSFVGDSSGEKPLEENLKDKV